MKPTTLKKESLENTKPRRSDAKSGTAKSGVSKSGAKITARPDDSKSRNDRVTLVAFYLFAGAMLLGVLYFISLVFLL